MATEPGLSEIITTTLRNRTKVLKDNIGNNNAFMSKMKENGSFEAVDGGRSLVEEMFFDENQSFGWYQQGELLNTSYNPTMTSAEFLWKQCAVAVTATGYEQRINSGANGIIKLVASRVKAAEITMQNQLNAAAWGDGTGSGGKVIGGLDLLVAKTPTSGTVGGIDRSTTAGAFYRNYTLPVVSTFGVAASAASIKQILTRVKINTTRDNEGPDIGLFGNSYYEYIMTAAMATQQIYDAKLAELGFENIVFCGIPCVLAGGVNYTGATQVGTTEGYVLNTKYIKLKYHKDCFMDPLEDRLSVNQDAMIKYIAFMGNMTLSNAKLQARVYDS